METYNRESKETICAVIISYNPTEIIEENIEALLPQVGKCLIVDNGSTDLQYILKLEQDKVCIERLQTNTGIAHALNVGLAYCIENNYDYILTMDQDTILEKDSVEQMLSTARKYSAVSVGINWDGKIQNDRLVTYLITSGNLVKVSAAESVGGFDEKFFIDSVDFDFSLKLIDKGYKLVKVATAKAIHNLGSEDEKGFVTHSVDRYYYIYRNHFYLLRKHRVRHPIFALKKNLALLYDLGKILLFDKQRKEKLSMLKKGYRDSRLLG